MSAPALLITGATGLVGRHLVARAPSARVLVRDPARARARLGEVDARPWNAESALPEGAMSGIEAVVHLAGEPIGEGRWTDARKARILASRVEGTRRVVDALRAAEQRPRVLVSASAVGWYGGRGDEELSEESGAGTGFLADVCARWEEEARAAEGLGVRVVLARLGVVLAPQGGALAPMLPLFRLGLGGPVGDGAQWMSWVHVDDVVGLLLHAATTPEVSGPMNACAPEPVTNATFARELGRALERPAVVRAPAIALRLAMGELSELVLGSQRVLPRIALRSGYAYRFPEVGAALRDVCGKTG